MTINPILFLHGFASSGHGRKVRYLTEKFSGHPGIRFQAIDFNPTPRDFEFMTVTGQINRLRQYVLDHSIKSCSLIGSSMGALVALHYAKRYPGVERLLLLAPALVYSPGISAEEAQRWQANGVLSIHHFAFGRQVALRYDTHVDGAHYLVPIKPSAPAVIIHGRRDDVIPIERSRAYAAEYPDVVQLVEVDADHRLSNQMDLIWHHATKLSYMGTTRGS